MAPSPSGRFTRPRGEPLPAGCRARDLLERLRVLERGEIAWIAAQSLCAHRPPHDLGAPRLRERGHEGDAVGPECLAELAGDLVGYRGRELLAPLLTWHESAEDPRHLALDVVRKTDCGRLGHRRVR